MLQLKACLLLFIVTTESLLALSSNTCNGHMNLSQEPTGHLDFSPGTELAQRPSSGLWICTRTLEIRAGQRMVLKVVWLETGSNMSLVCSGDRQETLAVGDTVTLHGCDQNRASLTWTGAGHSSNAFQLFYSVQEEESRPTEAYSIPHSYPNVDSPDPATTTTIEDSPLSERFVDPSGNLTHNPELIPPSTPPSASASTDREASLFPGEESNNGPDTSGVLLHTDIPGRLDFFSTQHSTSRRSDFYTSQNVEFQSVPVSNEVVSNMYVGTESPSNSQTFHYEEKSLALSSVPALLETSSTVFPQNESMTLDEKNSDSTENGEISRTHTTDGNLLVLGGHLSTIRPNETPHVTTKSGAPQTESTQDSGQTMSMSFDLLENTKDSTQETRSTENILRRQWSSLGTSAPSLVPYLDTFSSYVTESTFPTSATPSLGSTDSTFGELSKEEAKTSPRTGMDLPTTSSYIGELRSLLTQPISTPSSQENSSNGRSILSSEESAFDVRGSTPLSEESSSYGRSTPSSEESSSNDRSTPSSEESSSNDRSTPSSEESSSNGRSTPSSEESSSNGRSTPLSEESSSNDRSTPSSEESSSTDKSAELLSTVSPSTVSEQQTFKITTTYYKMIPKTGLSTHTRPSSPTVTASTLLHVSHVPYEAQSSKYRTLPTATVTGQKGVTTVIASQRVTSWTPEHVNHVTSSTQPYLTTRPSEGSTVQHKPKYYIVPDEPVIIKVESIEVLLQIMVEKSTSEWTVGLEEDVAFWLEPYLQRAPGLKELHRVWTSGLVVQCLLQFDTRGALQWLPHTGPSSLLERTGLRQAVGEGRGFRAATITNITLGGVREACDWLLRCPSGFTCVFDSHSSNYSCTSVCHSDYCLHHGLCTHHPGQPPVCRCVAGQDFWFMGQRCEVRMTRARLLLSCLGVLLLVLGVGGVLACMAVRRYRALLVQAKAEQTRSSYRRFNHFDELSGRFWLRSLAGSADSLDNPAFSRSDEILQLRALERPCCYHDDSLSLPSTCPSPATHIRTIYPHSSQYAWRGSELSVGDGVLDSGKASDLSVCSWPREPIQWSPFPLLQQLALQRPPAVRVPRTRSYCDGMELVDMNKSWTA